MNLTDEEITRLKKSADKVFGVDKPGYGARISRLEWALYAIGTALFALFLHGLIQIRTVPVQAEPPPTQQVR